MPQHSTLRSFLIGCAAVLIVAVALYAYVRRAEAPGNPSPTATTTEQYGVSGLPKGATVTEVPVTKPVAPDFRKPVAYDTSTTADVRAAIAPRFAADTALLAKDIRDFNAWMDLAILHKIGGDYRGAEAIWLYVTKAWPTSYVAFNNLGDLYQNFLKDPVKAKLYFDQAAKLQK